MSSGPRVLPEDTVAPPPLRVVSGGETSALLRLAAPLIVAQVAQMMMGVVGTAAAGRLGVQALAAQALGATTFTLVLITAYGLMAGLDPHVAQAIGAGQPQRAGQLYRQAVWLGLGAGVVLTLGLLAAPAALQWMGQEAQLVRDTALYLDISALGLLPAMIYVCCRSFCSAVGQTRAVMVAAVAGNLLNAWLAFDWVDRGWGLAGIAWASVLCRVVMTAGLLAWIQWAPSLQAFRTPWTRPGALLWPVVRSGAPLALQYGMEVAGFVLTTLWMGLLGAPTLAAHEVALSLSAIAFQVPFAIGTAASMRVGQAVGRRDAAAVARAGWTAFGLGLVFAVVSAAAMLAFATPMARLYLPTATPEVMALAVQFLFIAALFQLADGVQAIGFGVLRGLDDTRVPVLFNLLGFWLLGLPLGYVAVFVWHQHADRLWWGLSLALGVVAVALMWRFWWKAKQLRVAPRWPDPTSMPSAHG